VSGAQNSTGQTMASPYSYTFISSKSFPAACPCTVWPDVAPSSATDADDTAANNIGVQFKASENGTISGVRFYKEPDDTGTHTGTLWTAGGTQLATGTFTSEPTQGWAELDFSTPVSITAGTTYVASYQTPTGHYALTTNGFSSPVTNGPLTAVNGVYAYGSGLTFPTNTYSNSNFWVDVVFSASSGGPAPTVTGSTPVTGSSSNPVATDPTVTFSETVVPSSVSFTVKDSSGNSVAGSTSFNSGDTVATFTPSANLAAGTTFTVTVSGAQNSTGQTMASPYSYSFISSKSFPATCPCTVWPDVAPSTASDPSDSSPNNIGVQFKASENGTITGIRFYKEPDDTGTHTGTLWTASGTQLATGTFTSEPTQGWAELDFSTPVSITAGTTYVASYQTQTGHYAITLNGLSSPVTNGPLTAVNGVYAYGSGLIFPTNTYSNSNFWVDVIFQPS
jgi:hypothetical protein